MFRVTQTLCTGSCAPLYNAVQHLQRSARYCCTDLASATLYCCTDLAIFLSSPSCFCISPLDANCANLPCSDSVSIESLYFASFQPAVKDARGWITGCVLSTPIKEHWHATKDQQTHVTLIGSAHLGNVARPLDQTIDLRISAAWDKIVQCNGGAPPFRTLSSMVLGARVNFRGYALPSFNILVLNAR